MLLQSKTRKSIYTAVILPLKNNFSTWFLETWKTFPLKIENLNGYNFTTGNQSQLLSYQVY